VLALDVVHDGKTKRVLVPGTEGPADDQDAALVLDTIANRVYAVWQSQHLFSLAGFTIEDGWEPAVELAGDPASVKRNPQLTTSVVAYETLDEAGARVPAKRTLVHLVWYDEAAGGRQVYTAAAIEGRTVEAGAAFELRSLAGNADATANPPDSPPSLMQRPVARRGRDNDNIGLAFIDGPRGELVSLEMRPIDADLVLFADKARAVVIDLGRSGGGTSHRAMADKARAVVIDLGRRLAHPVIADFLSNTFLDALADSDDSLDLGAAVKGAWTKLITTGILLQQGSSGDAHIVELAPVAGDGSSRAVDLRWVSRRPLPTLPAVDLKLFLSPKAQNASIAWNAPSAVRYRESNPLGWEAISTIAVTPTLTREQAFKLVEQRLEDQ
jgi:hypothetical protein